MNNDVIIAIDFDSKQKIEDFLSLFKEEKPFIKIGMETYYHYGYEYVKELKDRGFKIFLDLKLHDIENTVVSAMKVLKKLDVEIINLHASVGTQCMKKVAEVFKDTNTKVISITVLTSIDNNILQNELNCKYDTKKQVLNLAKITKEANLDGVVCSPLEVSYIKENLGDNFLCITPGIRYQTSDEQKRVTTPAKARENKSDFIVVGRPITKSEDPVLMYEKIRKEFLGE